MFSKKRSIVILSLCVLGLFLSSALTYIHVMVHTDPSFSSVCAMGERLNCETVAASGWSVFMGIPVSVFGIVFYLILGLAALYSLMEQRAVIPGIGMIISFLGSIVSVGLFTLSSVVIHAFCLLCTATYVVNIVLFIVSLRTVKSKGIRAALMADLRQLAISPWAWVQTGALLLLLFVAGPFGGFPRYWEMASWRSGAPFAHGADSNGLPWLGAEAPTVVVTEYLDYDCPACRISHKKLRRLLSGHSEVLRVVRHEMPRTSCVDIKGGFEDRCLGARAAYCAMKQGRFWDVNDALLAKSKTGKGENRDDILALAVSLGFERKAFSACMSHPDTVARVVHLFESGKRDGVRVTPSYRVGDELLVGLDELIAHLDL